MQGVGVGVGRQGGEAKPPEKQVNHETVQFDEFIFGRREITD